MTQHVLHAAADKIEPRMVRALEPSIRILTDAFMKGGKLTDEDI